MGVAWMGEIGWVKREGGGEERENKILRTGAMLFAAMKLMTTHIMQMLHHKRNKRNIIKLLRFIGVLCVMIVVYTIGFHYLMLYEGREYSWISGLYWTLTVMSTLGFGDITFESDLGRVFSIVVLMSGLVFLLIMLPFTFIQFFYAPWIEAQAAARTPRELPEDTRGHVILTAHDPVTQALIDRLDDYGREYVVICPTLEEGQKLHDLGVKVMIGELDDAKTYRLARADQAALLATTLSDPVNTNVVFTVREIAPNIPVVATALHSTSIPILELAGAQTVLDLGKIMGGAMSRCTVGGDAITHVVGAVDELLIAEASASRTPLVGQTLKESRLRELGVNVIGVWDRGGFQYAKPDTRIGPTSILVLAGSAEQLQAYDEAFAIYNVSGEPVVVLGGGRIGCAAAKALMERGFEVRIVEQDAANVHDAARTIVGNAADTQVLEQAGMSKAPAVLITTHDDNVNLYLTIYCRRLRPDIQIIARSTSAKNVATLSRAGADFVLSYSSMGAEAMFNILHKSSLVTIAEGLEVFSIPLPESLEGKTIAESKVREMTGCTIVAVRFGSQGPEGQPRGLVTSPTADVRLKNGCELVLVGDSASRAKFVDEYGCV